MIRAVRCDDPLFKTVKFKEGFNVFFCYFEDLPDKEQNLLPSGTIRQRPYAGSAKISNDDCWKDEADKLCYFANVKSKSFWSLEAFLIKSPPF